MGQRIEFFYDIGSPYSYLAATRMAALEKETGATVVWRPFLLGGVFKGAGNQPPIAVPARAPYLLKDITRCSAQMGVPFRMPARFPTNSLAVMRTLAGLPEAELPEASLKMFRAYWYDGADIAAPDVIASVLGAEAVARAGDEAVKQKLKDNSDEAVRRGAFGAPTFFVGDEMFFGHDRIDQLKWWLAKSS
ncbi:MAG: 2-hydroxychromene-2-carboxylate isomerase [Pseudomonadota bacterium]